MFFVYAREVLGQFIFNFLSKVTLPKLLANELGIVFVPNGKFPHNTRTLTLSIVLNQITNVNGQHRCLFRFLGLFSPVLQ